MRRRGEGSTPTTSQVSIRITLCKVSLESILMGTTFLKTAPEKILPKVISLLLVISRIGYSGEPISLLPPGFESEYVPVNGTFSEWIGAESTLPWGYKGRVGIILNPGGGVNVAATLRLVTPMSGCLRKGGVPHKIVTDTEAYYYLAGCQTQVGKYITIWPNSKVQAIRTFSNLRAILDANHELSGLEGLTDPPL